MTTPEEIAAFKEAWAQAEEGDRVRAGLDAAAAVRRLSLTELGKLAAAAPPAPWRQSQDPDGEMLPDGTGSFDGYVPGATVYAEDPEGYCTLEIVADTPKAAALIVAMRNALPDLLDLLPDGSPAATRLLEEARTLLHSRHSVSAAIIATREARTESLLGRISTYIEAVDAPVDTDLRERLWQAVAIVRDSAPRVPNDADSYDVVDAVLRVLAEDDSRQAEAMAERNRFAIASEMRLIEEGSMAPAREFALAPLSDPEPHEHPETPGVYWGCDPFGKNCIPFKEPR